MVTTIHCWEFDLEGVRIVVHRYLFGGIVHISHRVYNSQGHGWVLCDNAKQLRTTVKAIARNNHIATEL